MDILFKTKRKSGLVLLKLGDNSTPKKNSSKNRGMERIRNCQKVETSRKS